MADPLQGRVALVTGAGRGLGRAYALALARLGCAVVVNSPPREGGASALAVVDEILVAGGRAVPFIGSAADPAGAEAAVEAAIAAFGKIDILVINAGVVLNKPFLKTTGADLQSMLDVHLTGPFAAVRRAFAPMLAQGWGRIVLTGTGSAAFGLENQSAYASAKAAMTGLCNVLKLEGRDTGVLVNVVLPVAPPLGRTPASLRIAEMFGERAGRLEPEWVAPLVCLLASDACPGTGGVYSAVAGRYARLFSALGPGWTAAGAAPPDLAEMIAHAGAITDMHAGHVPTSILDEIEAVAMAPSSAEDVR